MFSPWCADPAPAADLIPDETRTEARTFKGKKLHQGVASKNPALAQGITWSKSTTALGLPGVWFGNRNGSRCTGKERDSESQLDYFGARYYSNGIGRFQTVDPVSGTALHVVNPQRWNQYAYVVNNPLFYVDPDGRDAIAVNFLAEIPIGGHEGIIVVHPDGSATYARFGPKGGNTSVGPGEVKTQNLGKVEFQPNGLPTDQSYKNLAQEVASLEGEPANQVGFNYFKTSDTDTALLSDWIKRIKEASDKGKAPPYHVLFQNCATFCIAGLTAGHAIGALKLSRIPDRLFQLLSPFATENYDNKDGSRTSKEKVKHRLCTDRSCKETF